MKKYVFFALFLFIGVVSFTSVSSNSRAVSGEEFVLSNSNGSWEESTREESKCEMLEDTLEDIW